MTPALVLCLAVLASGAVSDCTGSGMDERTPLAQTESERTVSEGEFQIVGVLEAEGASFNPAVVTRLSGGDMLVYDAGSSLLLRYDSTGSVATRYGAGAGAGAGEHLRVVDIGEFESGEVWSFDQQKNVVNVFEAEGPLIRSITLQEPVHYLTARSAERMVSLNPTVHRPFRFHGPDGDVTSAFGWLLDEPGMNSTPYVGRLLPLEGGGFAYVMLTADVLKAWDNEGSFLWHRLMIDGFEPPGIYTEAEGSAYLEHPNGRSTITRIPLNASDGHIHAFVMNSTAEIVFIDTYDATDGSYVGSRRVPVTEAGCMPRYVHGTNAWMVCRGPTLVEARIPAL